MAGGFTRDSSITASIRYNLFDYYLSFVSSSIMRKIAGSERESHATRSLLYLAAYFLLIVEGDSAREV